MKYEEFLKVSVDFEIQMNKNYNKVSSITLELDNLDSDISDKEYQIFDKAKQEAEEQLEAFFEDIAKEYSRKCNKVVKSMTR